MATLADVIKERNGGSTQPTTIADKLNQAKSTLAHSQALADQAAQASRVQKLPEGTDAMARETSFADSPIGGLIKGATQPLARLGVNLASAATGLVNPAKAKQIDTEGLNLPFYGQTKPVGTAGTNQGAAGFGRDLTDTLGTGTELAASAIPAGRTGEIAANTLKGTLFGAAKEGAITGGTSGAMLGAGHEAQNPDATLGSIAGQGAIGGVAGAALGGVAAPAIGAISGEALPKTVSKVREYYANKEANPQVVTSMGRLKEAAPLVGAGAAKKRGLTELYDDFATQEGKHLKDIKEDPAISMVGERIGDEFGNVVKKRREAGTQMAEELKNNGSVKVDVADAHHGFGQDLVESGLERDPEDLTKLAVGNESKVNNADKDLLETYDKELGKLGLRPSVSQVDAMISRVSSDLDLYKSKNNITGTTNGERIIKKNLSTLRSTIDSQEGKLPQLSGYSKAKKTYSDLSNFIEEGQRHLGRLTQSGDYARDASLAKSAVQSVLNNGKKDWLLELEKHTGYPALDEASIALQAMKDAGDFKGSSLLDLMSEQATKNETPPSTLLGYAVAGSKAAMRYGKNKTLGTPAERTRALLKAAEEEVKNNRRNRLP